MLEKIVYRALFLTGLAAVWLPCFWLDWRLATLIAAVGIAAVATTFKKVISFAPR